MAFRAKLSKAEFRMNCHIDKNPNWLVAKQRFTVQHLSAVCRLFCRNTVKWLSARGQVHGAHSEKAGQSGRVRHVETRYYANVASQYQQTTVPRTEVDIE